MPIYGMGLRALFLLAAHLREAEQETGGVIERLRGRYS